MFSPEEIQKIRKMFDSDNTIQEVAASIGDGYNRAVFALELAKSGYEIKVETKRTLVQLHETAGSKNKA